MAKSIAEGRVVSNIFLILTLFRSYFNRETRDILHCVLIFSQHLRSFKVLSPQLWIGAPFENTMHIFKSYTLLGR